MCRFDFFLLMFPPTQLADSVRLTNDELVRRQKQRRRGSKAACGESGVMLRLKLVKGGSYEKHEPDGQQDGATRMLHGTRVLLFLLSPWYNSQSVVCADIYVASLGAAQERMRNGVRFIGVVKTATRRFPKQFFEQH